jgi:hypothetical protein
MSELKLWDASAKSVGDREDLGMRVCAESPQHAAQVLVDYWTSDGGWELDEDSFDDDQLIVFPSIVEVPAEAGVIAWEDGVTIDPSDLKYQEVKDD